MMYQEYLSLLTEEIGDFPLPSTSDRKTWESFPPHVLAGLVRRGEEFLHCGWPALPASLWLDFTRTGARTAYEDAYFARRRALCALVLAECAEHTGRFLDDIINGLWAICEESAWQLPAHNSYIRDTPQLPMPDTARPVPDLFACETGATLALVPLLLGPELDAVSPEICRRVRREVGTRIVTPYLTEHFWWMGDGDEPMCNWTPWCTQNALIAVLSTGQGQEVKRAAVAKALYSLDCFLKDYGDDGCCEEGPLYYRHAGLTLFGATEVLDMVTKGVFLPVYREEKVKNIAAYLVNVHVAGDVYLNFADAAPHAGPCGPREYLFGLRTGNEALMDLAAMDWKNLDHHDLPDEISLFYRLIAAFETGPLLAREGKTPSPPDIFYPSTGLWAARDGRFCLSIRAGHNGGSHGHNDAGSFILYRDGTPVFLDIGVESYTKKTFSPQRYEIWTMRSDWHNLPTIGGAVQQNGAAFGCTDVEWTFGASESRVSMELAGAYPGGAVVFSYRRTAALEKGRRVVIEDTYTGDAPAVLSLLCREAPVPTAGGLDVGGVLVALEGGGTPEIESVPIADPRLRQSWPETLYRVRVPVFNKLRITIE